MANSSTPAARPVAVFALFIALGLVFTWPLALYLPSGIPFAYIVDPAFKLSTLFVGDHLQLYYHLALMKKAALGKIAWFTNPYEFATPFRAEQVYTYALPVSALYLPFALVSETVGYNLLVLFSFGLTGLAMYLWAQQLTGSRAGGLTAAVAFNFLPLRLVELYGGHPAGLAIFLFPLTLYFFDRAITEKSAKWSALAGLSAFAFAYQYIYFCYYLLLFLLVYLPWRAIPAVAKNTREGTLSKFLTAGAPFALGLGAAAWAMLAYKRSVVAKSAFAGGRGMDEVGLFSPQLSAAVWPDIGYTVYLGMAGISALMAIVYAIAIPRRMEPNKRDMVFFSIVFMVSYALAFGVTLDRHIPLYSLFYDWVPAFKYSRVPPKIMVIAASAGAALTGYLTAAVIRMAGRRAGYLAAGMAGLLVMLDYHPKQAIGVCLLDEGNAIYARLAKEAKGGPVLNIPLWPGESAWASLYQYYALQSEVPMVNGYSPVVAAEYVEKVFWPLAAVNAGDLTAGHARLMRDLGARYLIFHENAYPPKVSAYPPRFALERLLHSPYLRLVEGREPQWLFEILPEAGGAPYDANTSPYGQAFQAEWLPPVLGTRVDAPAATGERAVFADKGVHGFLYAGPYRTYPAGAYRVWFNMRAGAVAPDEVVAVLDAAAEKGTRILARREIKGSDLDPDGGYRRFDLEYRLEPGPFWQVEFRVESTGAAPVWVDYVYANFADQRDPVDTLEAEDMYYIGETVADKDASHGFATLTRPGKDPATLTMYGAGRMYPAGKGRALFRLRSEDGAGEVARLEVFAQGAEKVVGNAVAVAVKGYRDFEAPFTLERDDALEFRVWFEGRAPVLVDSVRVEWEGGARP